MSRQIAVTPSVWRAGVAPSPFTRNRVRIVYGLRSDSVPRSGSSRSGSTDPGRGCHLVSWRALSTGGWKSARRGWAEYEVLTVVNAGSKLLIFGPSRKG